MLATEKSETDFICSACNMYVFFLTKSSILYFGMEGEEGERWGYYET